LGRSAFPIIRDHINIFKNLGYEVASSIGQDVIDRFLKGDIQEVTVIYNEFKSAMQQRVVEERLLPLARPDGEASGENKRRASEYLFEPEGKALLEVLLPRSLKIQVYRVLLESQAAELSARLMAMDAATKNAGEMIITLTRTYNRIRQAGITKELLEVVSGAEALN
jgi:F-type H+-transporting ATPase subunit gamma